MLNIKKILLVATLVLSLPTIVNASAEQDLKIYKSRLVTVEQDLVRYNEAIIPYQTALTVEPQVKLEDFNYYRDVNNKLKFDYKIVNRSDYVVYTLAIKLTFSSAEVAKPVSTSSAGAISAIAPHSSHTMPVKDFSISSFKNASVESMRTEHDLTGIKVVVDGKEYTVKDGDVTNSNMSLSTYLKFIESSLVKKIDLETKIKELEHPTP